MVRTCVDPYFRKIKGILHRISIDAELERRFRACERELRFLQMILWCFATWDVDIHVEKRANWMCVLGSVKGIWKKFGQQTANLHPPEPEENKHEGKDWARLTSYLEVAIQQSKPLIQEIYGDGLHGSLTCKPTASYEMVGFLDVVLLNLKALGRYKADKILLMKTQFETLKQRIILLQNFFQLTARGCLDCQELRDFKICLQTFANDAACLAFFYWVKDADEGITSKLNLVLSDVLQKITRPDVLALCLGALKAIKLQRSDDTHLLGHIIANFIDHLLENPVASLQNDIQMLRDGLIFLLTFLADPPKKYTQDEEGKSVDDPSKRRAQDEDGKSLADPPEVRPKDEQLISFCDQIDVLLQQASYLISPSDDMKTDSIEEKVLLSDFLDKIEVLKDNIKLLYVEIPCSGVINFPTVNGLRFFDHFLQNIRNQKEKLGEDALFIPFAKNYVLEIDERLVTLRPLLELCQDQHEVKDTWLEAIDLAYRTELVINSCWVILHPVWYNMICLAHILYEIKVIRKKFDQIKDSKVYSTRVRLSSVGSVSKSSKKTSYSETNEPVVGFEKDIETIIEKLRWGYKSLDVISIVGMAGQGKTTLAMKVYNKKLVRSHFHRLAFCSVSQVYNVRELLLAILSDMMVIDHKLQSMTKDDLAHQLWKCLSGQRYLVVLDDVWEITVWDDIKYSFPDDRNGSRIILTTREEKVALKAKFKSNPHRLCFFSDDHSWNLLQKKTFGEEGCPQDLSQIGMQIAKNCKGLPLAVVVVSGLLAREKGNIRLWNEVVEKTASYASKEGCKDVLELSYKHLPEHLKSCFLYFGKFSEDELISAKRLLLLWIGEGFIKKSNRMSLHNSAMEYLGDLVDRSLVIVVDKSSSVGIKTCRVHDLIHDMCRRKAQEENFFRFVHGHGSSSSSNSNVCQQYRACIQMSWKSFAYGGHIGPNIHSLLHCPEVHSTDGRSTEEEEGGNLSKSKLVQVLDLGSVRLKSLRTITSLIHLRYIAVTMQNSPIIPSWISNLWNLETFILKKVSPANLFFRNGFLQFRKPVVGKLLSPYTLGKMKRLMHWDLRQSVFGFTVPEEQAYPQLSNVESFSLLYLSERTVTETLQMLPNVRRLSCCLEFEKHSRWESTPSVAFDFLCQLESLKLHDFIYPNPCAIFPSTLKKLSLFNFSKDWRGIPAIAKLPKLEVLKMIDSPLQKWEIEDEDFPNLKFLKLAYVKLERWNASMGSFPCLERLGLEDCRYLDELPACFKESSTLRRIEVIRCRRKLANSAVEIQKEQMELGNEDLEIITSDCTLGWWWEHPPYKLHVDL